MLAKEQENLTLYIDAQLIEQAKQYATDGNISVSQLVEAFFYELGRKKTALDNVYSPLVQQLTGILPADTDAKQLYADYLVSTD